MLGGFQDYKIISDHPRVLPIWALYYHAVSKVIRFVLIAGSDIIWTLPFITQLRRQPYRFLFRPQPHSVVYPELSCRAESYIYNVSCCYFSCNFKFSVYATLYLHILELFYQRSAVSKGVLYSLPNNK